jgi:formate dehydrogenase major subunit
VRIDESLRPGLAFMTFHFQDDVATNVLTIDATDPKSGTAEFKATAIRVEKLRSRAPRTHRTRVRPES